MKRIMPAMRKRKKMDEKRKDSGMGKIIETIVNEIYCEKSKDQKENG